MTYIEGFLVPVPEANREAYRKSAADFAPIVQEFGVARHIEAWDSDVPEGKVTDFRKAVDATPEEKVVFSWFEYPDRAARDAANEKMMSDPRMKEMGSNMPFDGKRMVVGGFRAIVEEGSGTGGYTDGFAGGQFVNFRPTMLDDASWVAYMESWIAEKLPGVVSGAKVSFDGFPAPEQYQPLMEAFARDGARPS